MDFESYFSFSFFFSFSCVEFVGERNGDAGKKAELKNIELGAIEKAIRGLKFRYTIRLSIGDALTVCLPYLYSLRSHMKHGSESHGVWRGSICNSVGSLPHWMISNRFVPYPHLNTMNQFKEHDVDDDKKVQSTLS